MMTSTGKTLDVVSSAEECEKMEAWRQLILEFDPRAKSRAAGLTQKLLPEAQACYRHRHPGRSAARGW